MTTDAENDTKGHATALMDALLGPAPDYPKGTKVWTREGEEAGVIIGRLARCTLEGCSGWRVPVRWADNSRTYPCTQGLIARTDGDYQIG